MEVYWRLASPDASDREAATIELVRSLLLQQQDRENLERKQQGSNGENEHTEKKAKSKNSEKQGIKARGKRKVEEKETTTNTLTDDNVINYSAVDGSTSPKEERRLQSITHSNGNMVDGTLAEECGLSDCSPSVQYALRRLVRGVASSRQCARQGFAMALASLLEALPWLKTGSVLNLICKTLEVTSSMKGQEKRDGLLGQLFALGAVVRSGRMAVNCADMEDAKVITEQLLSLAKRKAFLREPAITLLIQFLEKLPPDDLQGNVLSIPLQEMLCMDIQNANVDTLLLALRLHKWLPYSVVESSPLLPNSKNIQTIFEPDHLLSLVPVLKDSSGCHPRLHLIWSDLVELLFQDSSDQEPLTPSKRKKKRQKHSDALMRSTNKRVAIFWKLIVDDSLLASSHERKFLAMELVQLFLPKLSASCIHCILSKTLVRCLLDILAAKGNLLYKSAQSCLASIGTWAKMDEERTVNVIISLQHASHGKFDALSKTKTVKELVSSLKSKEGCILLFNKLVEIFNGEKCLSAEDALHLVEDGGGHNEVADVDGKKKDDIGSDVKSLETQRYWVVEQIFSFAREISSPDLQFLVLKETLQLFTANALFVAPLGMKCYSNERQEEFWFPKLLLSDNTRKVCLARLQSLLLNMSSAISAGQEKKSPTGKAGLEGSTPSDLRFQFLELCDMFDNTPEVSRWQPVSEDEKSAIAALRSCLSQLRLLATDASSEQTQKVRAMCSLLMQLLLQSVTTGANDVTSELILCCKRAFGEAIEVDTADNSEEEETAGPFYMDVLVEILLSLLAQSSVSIRSAAEQVFKSFCGDLTESNMLNLLKVVKKQLNPGRRVATTPLDTGDSDEDQFLEIEDSDGDTDSDHSEDNDDEMDDEILEEPKSKRLHNTDLETESSGKKRVESLVCDHDMSKVGSDVEDNSGSDMDDEAMFRIDVHLANLLKQRRAANDKGEGKDAQTQLLHFKFRVLSLLEYFFQKQASNPLCLVSLPHLLHALVASSRAGGNAQLAERIGSVLQGKLFKSKDYPKGTEVDKAMVLDLLRRCMKLALRSKVKKVGKVIQSCSLWLMKVLHGQPSDAAEGCEDLDVLVKETLNDFFHQRKCRLKGSFFRELFGRFPGIAVTSLPVLLESCRKARTEYLQQEALQLVTFILHANCGKRNGQFKQSLSQNLPTLCELMVYLIEKPPSPSNKVKKSEIRQYCVSLLKAVAQELPDKPVKKHLGEPVYEICLLHFGASVADGIAKSKGLKLAQDLENTSKKRSKQKSSQD